MVCEHNMYISFFWEIINYNNIFLCTAPDPKWTKIFKLLNRSITTIKSFFCGKFIEGKTEHKHYTIKMDSNNVNPNIFLRSVIYNMLNLIELLIWIIMTEWKVQFAFSIQQRWYYTYKFILLYYLIYRIWIVRLGKLIW